jgi:hypothetical protein
LLCASGGRVRSRRAERAPADFFPSYKVHYAISTELLTKGGASVSPSDRNA